MKRRMEKEEVGGVFVSYSGTVVPDKNNDKSDKSFK
jgi:hypothetical protein